MWESICLTLAATAGNNIGKVLQKKGTIILPPLSLKLKVLSLWCFGLRLHAISDSQFDGSLTFYIWEIRIRDKNLVFWGYLIGVKIFVFFSSCFVLSQFDPYRDSNRMLDHFSMGKLTFFWSSICWQVIRAYAVNKPWALGFIMDIFGALLMLRALSLAPVS